MAICVEITESGQLAVTGDAVGSCSNWVLLDAADYATFQDGIGLTQLIGNDEAAQLFAYGFSLPVIVYLTAWGFGVVINWFNPRNEE